MACFSVGDGNGNGSGLLGLECALPFLHVFVVRIGGHIGVIIFSVNVFEAIKCMAKAGGVFGLRLGEAGEDVVITTLVEDLEDFDDGALDAFDVSVGRRPPTTD